MNEPDIQITINGKDYMVSDCSLAGVLNIRLYTVDYMLIGQLTALHMSGDVTIENAAMTERTPLDYYVIDDTDGDLETLGRLIHHHCAE